MPISKPDFNLIFASQAPSQDSPAAFNNYARGWDEARKNNGKPTIKQFNYLIQQLDLKALWMIQNGAALPFDETVDYAEGAFTVKDGSLQQFIGGVWKKPTQAADHIIDESGLSQQEWNNGVESIADLLAIPNPKNGSRVYVKSYHLGLGKGGGDFAYDSTKESINDGGYIFNGWTRQLVHPIFTPEMFGAKGDLSKDDAPSIRACVQSARANKIKCVQFYNKYLIDSPRITGQETLLEIIPDCSFLGFGDAELVVGDNIPDKFHILAAVNYIITTSNVGNVLIDGIKFRALSSATNMSSYTSNIAIHTFGLNNVCIQRCTFDDLDLANVIVSGIRYNGVDYGSKVTIQNNKILSVVAENPTNIDHSSIYMEAPDSFVLNNLFKSKTLQCRKVACGVEAHAKNIQTVGNQLYGYSRFGWLAALPNDVFNSNFIDNIAHVSNHLIILTSTSDAIVSKCTIKGNIVRCEHATSEVDFVTHQGLIVTSGLLDPLGWLESNEITVEGNTLNIDYSVNPSFATIANIEHDTLVRFSKNTVYGAVAGVNLPKFDSCCFTGNKVYNHITSINLNKDFFIQINGSGLNSADISTNEFKFNASTKPNYLIGLPNMIDDAVKSTSMLGNKYLSNQKPQADVYFQTTLNIGGNANTLDINVYNSSINVPALTAGQEYTWMQALPNNFNNCIVDLGIIAESRFYPLSSRAAAVGTSVPVRIKALETSDPFSVGVPSVNIKTR